MTARNLLVVLLEEGHESQLRRVIATRGDAATVVHVVAPAHVSAAQWLATAEDDARIDAESRAMDAEWALREDAVVEGGAGESDPVLAAKDALRTFPADEILLVGEGGRNGGVERSLRELGMPVTRIPGGDDRVRRRSPMREAFRAIARGESRATPFVVIAGVNLVMLFAAAVISVIVVLVLLAAGLI